MELVYGWHVSLPGNGQLVEISLPCPFESTCQQS